ncbi:hypothetical protein L4C34_04430 [Vibrio profundum]|uniref:hypothetical protein n=1 Tax=Vibrio profundum TaxID=2910247 RepID=UPI003D0C4597
MDIEKQKMPGSIHLPLRVMNNNSNILIRLSVNTLTSVNEFYRKKKNKNLTLTAKLQANFIIPPEIESPRDLGDVVRQKRYVPPTKLDLRINNFVPFKAPEL